MPLPARVLAPMVFVVLAGAQALLLPPLVGPDEPAHLGYVEVLLEGELPTIDTPNPVDGTFRVSQDVWVANHPPLFYGLGAPLVAAGAGGAGLRLLSVALAAVGVWLTGRLAGTLSPHPAVALGAMGLAAVCPQLIGASAYGQNDGLTFTLAVAVLLVGVRARGSDPLPVWLAVAVVVAACLTKASLLIAVPFLALCYLPRWRASAAIVGGAILGAGWWYARNLTLYDDLTGGSYLQQKFGRTGGWSLTHLALHPSWLGGAWQDLWASFRRDVRVGTGSITIGSPSAIIGTSMLLGALVLGAVLLARLRGRAPLLLWTGAVLAGVAHFVAGGGTPHSRYLLPVLPVVAVLAADGLRRPHRWALAGTVGLFAVVDVVLLSQTWTLSANA